LVGGGHDFILISVSGKRSPTVIRSGRITIPEAAVDAINRIQIRSKLNSVIETEVPGFIAKGG